MTTSLSIMCLHGSYGVFNVRERLWVRQKNKLIQVLLKSYGYKSIQHPPFLTPHTDETLLHCP